MRFVNDFDSFETARRRYFQLHWPCVFLNDFGEVADIQHYTETIALKANGLAFVEVPLAEVAALTSLPEWANSPYYMDGSTATLLFRGCGDVPHTEIDGVAVTSFQTCPAGWGRKYTVYNPVPPTNGLHWLREPTGPTDNLPTLPSSIRKLLQGTTK